MFVEIYTVCSAVNNWPPLTARHLKIFENLFRPWDFLLYPSCSCTADVLSFTWSLRHCLHSCLLIRNAFPCTLVVHPIIKLLCSVREWWFLDIILNAYNRFSLPIGSLVLCTKPTSHLDPMLLIGEFADVAVTLAESLYEFLYDTYLEFICYKKCYILPPEENFVICLFRTGQHCTVAWTCFEQEAPFEWSNT